MKNNIFRSLRNSLGNIIEWYDFSLYGYFAAVIAVEFFPSDNHFIALLATFAAFGIGFLARPLGAIVFGALGDKKGRYYAMNLSILLMAIPTTLMAILPGYNTIGILAPILLVLIRIIQGISAGGQFGNLLTITSEDSKTRYTGFSAGIAYSSSVIGFLIAAGVSYLVMTLTPDSWHNIAWRLPFALSLLLLFTQLKLRKNHDSESVERPTNSATVEPSKPLSKLIELYPRCLFYTIILSTVTSFLYYLVLTYMITYMTDYLNLSLSQALGVNVISIVLLCLLVPVFGIISDLFGRKRFLIVAFLITLLTEAPLISLLQPVNYVSIILASIGLAVITALIQGAATPLYSEIFPRYIRASGCSIGFGIGTSIAGFSPMIATGLTGFFSPASSLYILFFMIAFVGLAVAILIPHKKLEVRRLQNLNIGMLQAA
ncbi:MFS transporter [Thiotrichales bacterium 19S3-7]|nr:MFS transporter [Thiotrichales bacterium 19S3-7]MCF6802166.1 MFS transporter [Thiotrichales bacterium 19S3-11]